MRTLPGLESESLAEESVGRLMRDFHGDFGVDEITTVVTKCRNDLSGEPVGALPELVERLARQRLSDLVA